MEGAIPGEYDCDRPSNLLFRGAGLLSQTGQGDRQADASQKVIY